MRALVLALSLVACEAPPPAEVLPDVDLPAPSSSVVRPALEAPEGVALFTHPCGADGVSAMAWDGQRTAWIGCRSAPGLWRSGDAGQTWAAAVTDPPGRFADVVVTQVARSADDLLYVVGEDGDRGGLVVAMDRDGWTEDVLLGSEGFAPGLHARDGAGLSAVASLDGLDLGYRFNDGAAFAPTDHWGPRNARLNDLVAWGEAFYGVGSAPALEGRPPAVFLEPDRGQDAALGFRLDAEVLGDLAARGELLDLEVDEGGLVAAGVDEERGCGLVVTSGPDPDDVGGWRAFDLGVALPREATALEGACRDLEVVVAVGARGEDGLALRSDDGGRTWTELLPEGTRLPRLQRCRVLDGEVVAAGADGIVAHLELRAP